MESQKPTPKIFLSHSHKDKPFVERIANDLLKAGIEVWYDSWELEIGHNLTIKIQDGISASEYLAIILSPDAIQSDWVEIEWTAAFKTELEKKKVVILPVLYRDCEIPLLLKNKVYADFRVPKNYETKLTLLINQLQGIPKKPQSQINTERITNYSHMVRASFQGQMQLRKGDELEIHRWLGDPHGEERLGIGNVKNISDGNEYDHVFPMMTIIPVSITITGRVRGNIYKKGNQTEFDFEMNEEEYQKYFPHREAKRSPFVR